MGIIVYSLQWVVQDFAHQQYNKEASNESVEWCRLSPYYEQQPLLHPKQLLLLSRQPLQRFRG